MTLFLGQLVCRNAPAYVNGISEAFFKVGICLPAGSYVTDDDVRYIVGAFLYLVLKNRYRI